MAGEGTDPLELLPKLSEIWQLRATRAKIKGNMSWGVLGEWQDTVGELEVGGDKFVLKTSY